jgi:hypothetical protein
MNQPKEKNDEQPDIPVPADEEQPAPVREPDNKIPVEEPESEKPKQIVKT